MGIIKVSNYKRLPGAAGPRPRSCHCRVPLELGASPQRRRLYGRFAAGRYHEKAHNDENDGEREGFAPRIPSNLNRP